MRHAARLSRVPLFLTISLLVFVLVVPGRAEIAFRVYVLVLAAYGLAHALDLLRRELPERRPSAVDAALRPRLHRVERVADLDRIEREVALGLSTAFDLHFRLRPPLRRIASELLRSRRGIDLDRDPAAARAALGDETWELVRADRESPDERFGPGLELPALRRVVASLEAL